MMSAKNRMSRAMGTIWKIIAITVPIVVGLGLLVAVIAWLAGAFEPKIEPGRIELSCVNVVGQETDAVRRVTKPFEEEALGTLKSASRTVVSSKVLANIVEIGVTAGDQVQSGDLVIRLNDAEFLARLSQAKQALNAGTATRVEADGNLKRQETLWGKKAISEAALDEAVRRAQVARAEESRLQQAVQEADISLSDTMIRAPMPGRVVDRQAEPGDMARPGIPLLTIYDETSLRVEAPVLERLAVQLHKGQQLHVHIDAVNKDLKATVDEIVPQADAPSRSFLVKASLPRSEDLYEGMFARLMIPAGTRDHLCIPTDAIQTIGQLEFVYVVHRDQNQGEANQGEATNSDGTNSDGGGTNVERRYIKTGRLGEEGRIEVLSGVRAGEFVLLNPTFVDPMDETRE